jgi:membrane protein YdbS with pleckstrin-like domain
MNPNTTELSHTPFDPAAILAIERPHPKLMTYYFICCLLTVPLFPILIIPYYFRYHTMRYRFDAEGVSMRWGILFRREVILNYSRIQDIHLQSNFIERWLGLGRVLIQTASGSANAEMTIEGLLEFEVVRDFLYTKMRGAKEKGVGPGAPSVAVGGSAATPDSATAVELVATLRAVTEEVRALREAIERRKTTGN